MFINESSRSYVTGHDKDVPRSRGDDYGTFVVAYFNFDEKEDLAVRIGYNHCAGYDYIFYVQENGRYTYDKYLSDNFRYFQDTVDKTNKTLSYERPCCANWSFKQKCRYETKKGKWTTIHSIIIEDREVIIDETDPNDQ